MSELVIEGLHASVGGKEILRGVDLAIASGQVHAVMGPERLWQVHPFSRHSGPARRTRSLRDDHPGRRRPARDADMATRRAGALPRPAVPDRSSRGELGRRARARRSQLLGATRPKSRHSWLPKRGSVGFDESFLSRPLNVDLSGGERKRNEVVQLGVLRPSIAVLDEIDSGLDVDALRAVARRVAELAREAGHRRAGDNPLPAPAFRAARRPGPRTFGGPGRGHGGPELAIELEETGYVDYGEEA